MPTLNWIGKEKVVSHHHDVPFRVLEHKYRFDGKSETVEKEKKESKTKKGLSAKESKTNPQSQKVPFPVERAEGEVGGNKIIHGDNLEALKSLLPEYEGKIKCIYIDPPYNTGNENWVYNDNVNHPKIKKWLSQVVGKDEDDLSRHDKWLCMMYPRLKLLHKLLHKDGVLFVSLDENENCYLKLILNEIFGSSNFIAQITLLCNPKGRSQDKYFSTSHEYITVYSKSAKPKDSFSITKDDNLIEKEYKLKDENGRYRLIELRNTHREFNRINRPNLFYPLYVNKNTGNVSLEKSEYFTDEVTPVWPDGEEGCWTWGKELAIKDNSLLIAQKIKAVESFSKELCNVY
ncbi:MAG: site-specific DNA-methyltransferase [Crocinitomicaceae bacterium]|nr:site-specific DNA-methyltransferase [Crocinitomicaceae bacterium]